MAKTIIAMDGSAVNYANVLTIYDDVEKDKRTGDVIYELCADVTTGETYLLGAYNTEEEAVHERDRLINWLEREAFGVYSVIHDEGE